MKKAFKFVTKIIVITTVALILFFSVKGYRGNPTIDELNSKTWKENGPFELSPERGRFAITYSFIEDHKLHFSLPVARFATPDLGIKNGNYVSLFAPGVSFLLMPGYLIGKYFGFSQVGAFSTIILFALSNFILIFKISKKIGASDPSSLLAALIFIFATPAFAYATTIYQHHVSVFLILSSIYILLSDKINFLRLFIIWALIFTSIPVDYPNLILMFPIGLIAFGKFIKLNFDSKRLSLSIDIVKALSVLGIIVPLGLMMIFNYRSYGNYFQFASTVGGVQEIDDNGNPAAPKTANLEDVSKFLDPEEKQRSAVNFFKSRHQINGLYILLLSPDRGLIVYTPILIVGLLFFYYRRKYKVNSVIDIMFAVLVFNFIMYSMRSDAWGGWSFGSRYLIPAYSILSIFLALVLTKIKNNLFFMFIFYVLMTYSIVINTLGALTTSAIPPKIEAQVLEVLSGKRQRYYYDRNWEFINSGKSKSFAFQTWGKNKMNSLEYYYLTLTVVALLTTSAFIWLVLENRSQK